MLHKIKNKIYKAKHELTKSIDPNEIKVYEAYVDAYDNVLNWIEEQECGFKYSKQSCPNYTTYENGKGGCLNAINIDKDCICNKK